MKLGLLLYDVAARAPVQPQLIADAHVPEQRPADVVKSPHAISQSHLLDDRQSRDSLPAQRWGVIAPAGAEGDALLAQIDPLIAARAAQQGIPAGAVKRYRVTAPMSEAQAADWIQNVLLPSVPTEKSLPRYLLILGDFDQVPLELQLALASRFYPGRIAFDRLDDYGAYAAKVLKYEQPAALRAPIRSLTMTSQDGTVATELGYDTLMKPARELTEKFFPDDFPLQLTELPFDADTAIDDLRKAASAPHPTLLWTLSHGAAVWPKRNESDDEFQKRQQQAQGAPVFGAKPLTPSDVASGPFLPGGMWFLFACYGAGTPTRSAYWHWFKALQEDLAARGQPLLDSHSLLGTLARRQGFVAAVPKAALANPEGPVAVIGHVDVAFGYSFGLDIIGRRLGTIQGSPILRYLRVPQYASDPKEPARVGVALASFASDLAPITDALADSYDRAEAARRGGTALTDDDVLKRDNLWMLRQDLRAFVLLGDPAAQLPLGGASNPAQ